MARNRVQFQKGYSLVQFMDEYGTEEKCTEAVFRWRWPNGFVCPRCEHTGHWRHQSRALYQCRRCRHQVSLTAGTILASTKLPLRTWFLAMYLLTQTKNGISALELSRQLAVSYNTAWKVTVAWPGAPPGSPERGLVCGATHGFAQGPIDQCQNATLGRHDLRVGINGQRAGRAS